MHASFRSVADPGTMDVPAYETLVNRYPGIKAINEECNRIYPDQLNPMQIQSLIKCWRGGPDPLDYISIFSAFDDHYNNDVPPHWHYVSYGLSDLHCDGRVFLPEMFGPDKSGFGIELSFRLQKQSHETDPPLWPAKLMQCLARYVYKSGQPFLSGDHISWHQSLNPDDPNSNKELCQILLTSDPQLQSIRTPAGNCEFIQIVPVTTEELLTVQKWSVNAFLDLMRDFSECGGKYLVTDITRVKSLFEIKPSLEQELIQRILQDGSDLGGVNAAVCSWTPEAWKYYDQSNCHYLKEEYQRLYRHLRRSRQLDLPFSRQPELIEEDETRFTETDECHSSDELEDETKVDNLDIDLASSFNSKCRMDSNGNDPQSKTWNKDNVPLPSSIFAPSVTYFDLIHITINLEAGFCFPLALTGRLRHGRHFTFKGSSSTAITLVSPAVQGSFVSEEKPFGAYGGWLQILLKDQLVEAMVTDFELMIATPNVAYPKTFIWPQWSFGLTLVL